MQTLKKVLRSFLHGPGFFSKFPRRLAAILIYIYQRTFSPDHGPGRRFFPLGYCPFYPSCSEYGRQVVLKYGLLRGGPKLLWRILRCHPLTKGGVDLP